MWRVWGILCACSAAWAGDASSARIRDAAAKAVALMQTAQKSWGAHTDCSSCHHQVLPAMAYRAARTHGIAVDETAAHANAVHAFGYLSNLDRAVQYTHVIDPANDTGYNLMGADAAGVRPSLVTAVYARQLALRQKPDGHWVTGDARPPMSYGSITATAVILAAIERYSHRSQEADLRERVPRARAWLASQQARNTEERSFQLFGLCISGVHANELARFVAELKAAQNADGGWGSLDELESDAYSTGEALWALTAAAGVPIEDSDWQRGVQFLLDTQAPDGSWHVRSRQHPPPDSGPPYFESGFPYGHDQFLSMAGTSWAVIALAKALGPEQDVPRAVMQETEPSGIEAWMETMLFGSASEVDALLRKNPSAPSGGGGVRDSKPSAQRAGGVVRDSKPSAQPAGGVVRDSMIDPNSATKAGTTALMLAVPDVEKTKVLLAAGAKINARSKSRYSALLVAAIYPGASPVLRLLLDEGAEVRMPKGAGTPLFNATALGRAAEAGNVEAIPWFLAKGDQFTDKFVYTGTSPGPMVMDPFLFGDVPTAQALLEAGMDVEFADAAGVTLLDFAVLQNQVGIARLLIARGANVNTVDRLGMTPLMYTTHVDFGDSQMLDLLLESGADPTVRNRDGLNALDLARKYNESHLIARLALSLSAKN